MIRITNIWATDRAYEVLRERRAKFRPRHRGEVFALSYMVSFTNADGTTVDGFRPGYVVDSHSLEGLDGTWAFAQLIDGPDFLFMPKFKWRSDGDYVVDMASDVFAIFSIGPAARQQCQVGGRTGGWRLSSAGAWLWPPTARTSAGRGSQGAVGAGRGGGLRQPRGGAGDARVGKMRGSSA